MVMPRHASLRFSHTPIWADIDSNLLASKIRVLQFYVWKPRLIADDEVRDRRAAAWYSDIEAIISLLPCYEKIDLRSLNAWRQHLEGAEAAAAISRRTHFSPFNTPLLLFITWWHERIMIIFPYAIFDIECCQMPLEYGFDG